MKNASKDTQYQQLYDAARQAGLAAVAGLKVVPMVINQHANLLNDNSPITQQFFVADGPCGFAWIRIKPANNGFAKWLLAKGMARKSSYYGGVAISVMEFNQSLQKKETYAHAFAAVLHDAGIRAYGDSRID